MQSTISHHTVLLCEHGSTGARDGAAMRASPARDRDRDNSRDDEMIVLYSIEIRQRQRRGGKASAGRRGRGLGLNWRPMFRGSHFACRVLHSGTSRDVRGPHVHTSTRLPLRRIWANVTPGNCADSLCRPLKRDRHPTGDIPAHRRTPRGHFSWALCNTNSMGTASVAASSPRRTHAPARSVCAIVTGEYSNDEYVFDCDYD